MIKQLSKDEIFMMWKKQNEIRVNLQDEVRRLKDSLKEEVKDRIKFQKWYYSEREKNGR